MTLLEDIKCKKLIATFQEDKLMLGGPKNLNFHTGDNITVKIEQLGIRIITVEAEQEESFRELYGIFTKVERLLMLLDGRFIALQELSFKDSAEGTLGHLKSYANNIMQTRLSYYNSADFCSYSLDKLIDFDSVITTELYSLWQELLDELDIAHQMYLYSLSDSKMPIDAKCAFLIELAEPLVEIVKAHTHFYSSLNPGERGTSLKMCVDALISKYGTDIFAKEITSKYDKFLQTIVNSRVRIMHIKRQQKGLFLNGPESVLYAQKMTLLYRKILFEILDIDEDTYKENMQSLIDSLDKWNDIQEKFLAKLK